MVSELIYCCDDSLTLGRPVLKVDFSYHSIPGGAQDASIRISWSVCKCHEGRRALPAGEHQRYWPYRPLDRRLERSLHSRLLKLDNGDGPTPGQQETFEILGANPTKVFPAAGRWISVSGVPANGNLLSCAMKFSIGGPSLRFRHTVIQVLDKATARELVPRTGPVSFQDDIHVNEYGATTLRNITDQQGSRHCAL